MVWHFHVCVCVRMICSCCPPSLCPSHPLLLPSLYSLICHLFNCFSITAATVCFQDLFLHSISLVNLGVFRKGFEDDRIEALLHKIEIQMKHQSTSFGLALTSVCDLVATSVFPFRFDFCFITNNSLWVFFNWYILFLFLFETRSCHVAQAQFWFSILDGRVTGVHHDVPQNCSS